MWYFGQGRFVDLIPFIRSLIVVHNGGGEVYRHESLKRTVLSVALLT